MTRQEKARQLRYKKAVLDEFNLESIQTELWEITEECDNIRWVEDGDERTLIDALDGDEEEAFEFRMMFSELSAECEHLHNILSEEYINEYFDDFLAGVSDGSGMRMIGYDTYEEDYYGLTSFEGQKGCAEAQKRLERLTKKEIIAAGNQTFRLLICFLNVRYKYDYLKASFDILKGKNTAFLDVIRQIEKAYDDVSKCDDCYVYADKMNKEFDNLVSSLPDWVWIE